MKNFAILRFLTLYNKLTYALCVVLCVETLFLIVIAIKAVGQPPSGGCVLKHYLTYMQNRIYHQPPSGGCVLKLCYYYQMIR